MNKNYLWFLNADLRDYQGKYIAIAEQKVVSSGDDPGEVYEEAKAQYPGKEVVLWKVPEGESLILLAKSRGWENKLYGIRQRNIQSN